MGDEVEVHVEDGVATVELAAPERRNALTATMARELHDALVEVEADPAVGAVVVRGSGGHFCAGGERETLARIGEDPTEASRFDDLEAIYQSFQRLGSMQMPTVAAVRGVAVGAGTNLMLSADLRVVAEDARILSGFLRIGVHPGGGHLALVGRLAGREATTAMALFGEEIDGVQAHALGLAWAVVPDPLVDGAAMTLARRVAADPELARRTVRTIRSVLGPPSIPWHAAVDAERAPQMWSMRRRAQNREGDAAREG